MDGVRISHLVEPRLCSIRSSRRTFAGRRELRGRVEAGLRELADCCA